MSTTKNVVVPILIVGFVGASFICPPLTLAFFFFSIAAYAHIKQGGKS